MTTDLQGRRILVVEDERMVSMMIEEMLRDLGCAIIGPAVELNEALALAVQAPIDMALLDVNLRGKSTYAVADILSERGVPYIFATGYGGGGLDKAYQHLPVLQKPFQLAELERALLKLFQGS